MKSWLVYVVCMVAVILSAGIVFGEEVQKAAAKEVSNNAAWFYIVCVLAAGFGMAIATIGTALGQGLSISRAVEGVARQPEASGKITVTMIIGLAMIESLAIYALVVALIILFANPFAKFFAG